MYSCFYESKERKTYQLEKTKDGENLFFKSLANRFWLTSKSYSWFNKVAHARSSIKWTSGKGNWSVTKSRLDAEFVKKITLEIVIGQQMKEEGLDKIINGFYI